MQYRKLGQTDFQISKIGFGCMSLKVHSKKNSIDLLAKAYENGINYFDTADLYDKGENEKLVGEALQSIRNKIYIATKVGNEWNNDGTSWRWNTSREYIIKAVEQSLKRLKTDYIDLYQLHGGTLEDNIPEIIETFELLKTQGKIREYGISSIRPNVINKWTKLSNMQSVMMQYSLLDRRPEEECLPLLENNNISVITRGTLTRGLLLKQNPDEYLNYSTTQIKYLQEELSKFDNKIALLIHFALKNPVVTSIAAGIRTQTQLDEILKAYKHPVSAQTLEEISKILPVNKYETHRV